MRYICITKKQIMLALSLVVAVAVVIIGSAYAFASANKRLPIYCVETEKKQIAISFDAAWGNDDTQQLIDILAKYDVPATFFVVGAWVDKYPESVKQLHDAGHQIQNHSNTHPHMPQLSKEQMRNEINSCNKKIESITGICPTLFRAPYGDYDNATIETIESMNMYTIQWDVELSATVGIPHEYWGGVSAQTLKNNKIYHIRKTYHMKEDVFLLIARTFWNQLPVVFAMQKDGTNSLFSKPSAIYTIITIRLY